jgi:hypothetical protein
MDHPPTAPSSYKGFFSSTLPEKSYLFVTPMFAMAIPLVRIGLREAGASPRVQTGALMGMVAAFTLHGAYLISRQREPKD